MYTIDFYVLLCLAPFVGSFLGVVILRDGHDRPFWQGRSACERCGHLLGIFDLVPLFSWLLLRRRCRYCAAKLGGFYPAVELAALLPVAWAGLTMSGPILVVSTGFGWGLITLAWIDARQCRLPDLLTLPLLLAGLLAAYCFVPDQWIAHVIGAVAGFVGFSAISLSYRCLRGRDGLGLGDAKFLAALGGWVSWTGLPSVIFLAAVAALAYVLIAYRHRPMLQRRVPFGPFLAAAAWIVWLYGPLVIG